MNEFIGKTIVFSGFEDDHIVNNLKHKGVNFSSVTNEGVDFVVYEEQHKSRSLSSSKIKMAYKLNIPRISKKEFYDKIYNYNLIER